MTILWNPENTEQTHLFQFMKQVQSKYNPAIHDWSSLYQWSVEHTGEFWQSFLEFSGLVYEGKSDPAVVSADRFQDTKFFPDLRINMAENLLRHSIDDVQSGRGDRVRLISYREDGLEHLITSKEILTTVRQLQRAMTSAGVVQGDRVAAYMPNTAETICIMMAALSIGAVFSSSSPDFGADAVLARFQQIQPKLLFAAGQVLYRGRIIDKKDELHQIQTGLPDLKQTVVIPLATNASLTESFGEFTKPYTSDTSLPEFLPLPFSHPVYIMYSSGTTGLPKCMVQGAGVLLNHLKELLLHTDLKADERIFYFTTCGWMMWNWLASSLATGAVPVLYDGHPFMPDANVLWRMAERYNINVFGTSAGYLAALARSDFDLSKLNLSPLRAILSTGSPLLPEQFDFVYNHIKKDVQLSSISGGTDLNGCFVLGNPILPVRRGEIQCAGLGMAVDVVDEQGRPVAADVEGELICRKPFVSQPLFFWNDDDGSKYQSAYFDSFAGVWRHGDFIIRTANGGFRIQGRSDATLNPGGVRIGTADIYRVVDGIDEVSDSVVIGPSLNGEVKVLLFVVLRPGFSFNDELAAKLRSKIKTEASPRHIPDSIFAVAEIPYTRNMKKVEIAVRNIFEGRPVTNKEALSNADCLKEYEAIAASFRT